jgi:hypothetical protein
MLDDDPGVAATVIAVHLRPLGFGGSLTILKDHPRRMRSGSYGGPGLSRPATSVI